MVSPNITHTFLKLLDQLGVFDNDSISAIETVVLSMYSLMCAELGLDQARKELFAHGRHMDNTSPTRAALIQHMKRAIYKANYI